MKTKLYLKKDSSYGVNYKTIHFRSSRGDLKSPDTDDVLFLNKGKWIDMGEPEIITITVERSDG